jgi:hypothetical protein
VQPGCTQPIRCPRNRFKDDVEKELTGQDTEPVEIIYFKVYKSQGAVIEQAIGTAALMLGFDRSRLLAALGVLFRRSQRNRPESFTETFLISRVDSAHAPR